VAQPRLPEGVSFSFESKIEQEKLMDALLANAHAPTFPFIKLQLKSDESANNNEFEVRIPPLVHKHIKNLLLTDQIVLFVSPNGQFGIWGFDILASFEILKNFKIIDNMSDWIMISRSNLNDMLNEKKIETKQPNKDALQIIEEILTSVDLLDILKNNIVIPKVVKDVIASNTMNYNTIIYRLGMAIHHSKRRSGIASIESLDDAGSLYLKLTQSEILKKYSKQLQPLMDLPSDGKLTSTKVFFSFLASAYFYYREVNEQS